MKLTLLTFVVLLSQHAFPQDTATHRVVISLSGGAFLPRQAGRNVIESFSYTSTPTTTGITGTQQFSGSLGGNFSSVDYVGDIMNIDVTSHRHAINGGMGLFQTSSADDGGYFKAGYARVLHFHRNRFRFQPGIDVYWVLGSQNELGRIDNQDQTLQLLGHTAAPQWTAHYSDRYGNYSKTYSARYLSVLYRRDAILIQPKLAFYATFRRLVLGFQAGWMFQLSQGCVLILRQGDDNGDWNTIAKIHQPHNGSDNGLYTSLSVGFINRSRHLFRK